MPPKSQQKPSCRKEETIPIVDTDTVAMTIIELFSDARVAATLKKAMYKKELVDQLDHLSSRVTQTCHMVRIVRIQYGFWHFLR